eukprot:tig00021036_g17307.t1
MLRLATRVAAAGAAIGASALTFVNFAADFDGSELPVAGDAPARALRTRAEHLADLGASSKNPFDVLVIGGGATGAGIALDCATRGLRCAMVERDDFAAGTSSRSTKLIHGGIRYLEKAFFQLDPSQFNLVFEALHERRHFYHVCPFNAYVVPIMIPTFAWWEVPYYWAGAKAYDLVAGLRRGPVPPSHFVFPGEAMHLFPTLRREGLKGTVVYYDGMQNDARVNVLVALTAAAKGAAVVNHCGVVRLLKDKAGKVIGARVRDGETGREIDVRAKAVINAAGPFCDGVREMDEPGTPPLVTPSVGVHIVLPDHVAPSNAGLIVPKTRDGRVLFCLPWEGSILAGTTDSPARLEPLPAPSREDVEWILRELGEFLRVPLEPRDVRAAWSGFRPLAAPPAAGQSAARTSDVVRDHFVTVSPSGLLTITGGKWTTYRYGSTRPHSVPAFRSV